MTPRERFIVLSGFMFVIVATFVAAILVGLGLFEEADPGLFKWLIGTGIAEISAGVLWAFRDSFRLKGKVSVNIVFRGKSPDAVDLDSDKCSYELRHGESNEVKAKGKLLPTLGLSGWQCVLPSSVSPTDYIKLFLTEKNGDRWEVGWFVPLVTTKEAVRV